MDLTTHNTAAVEMSRSTYEQNAAQRITSEANSGKEGALEKAAKEFEGIFVKMLLKSMRQAQDALADKDSPFNSEQVKFYRDMHDQELANEMASKGSIGLAAVIVQQMSKYNADHSPGLTNASGDAYTPENLQAKFGPNVPKVDDVNPNFNSPLMPSINADTSNIELSTTLNANKRAAFNSPMDFVKSLYPQAIEAAKSLNIDPKALLAQAALETGWGKYVIHQNNGASSNNLFGIKADNRWQGEKAEVDTLEYVNNAPQKERAIFRSYGDFESSLKDYVNFVQSSPRYQQALEQTQSVEKYFNELQQAGYATDPAYAEKVMAVYNGDLLNGLLP